MIFIKSSKEIAKMREAGKILASVYMELKKRIRPGITTMQINDFVEKYLKHHRAIPEQKGYHGFPYAICASSNDEICHGFPSRRRVEEGDVLKIDMVVNYNGWLADSARTFLVGEVSEEAKKLVQVTKKARGVGIEQAISGNRLGDVGCAIQTYVEGLGYSVVRDFTGHGIGRLIHEDPQVDHVGKKGRGQRITEGMVFTVEPMINQGDYHTKIDANGWTARTIDGKLSAQFEHTIAITENGTVILTDLEGLDD